MNKLDLKKMELTALNYSEVLNTNAGSPYSDGEAAGEAAGEELVRAFKSATLLDEAAELLGLL